MCVIDLNSAIYVCLFLNLNRYQTSLCFVGTSLRLSAISLKCSGVSLKCSGASLQLRAIGQPKTDGAQINRKQQVRKWGGGGKKECLQALFQKPQICLPLLRVSRKYSGRRTEECFYSRIV
ncbi:hypothetical protein BZG01_04075 [Labilibaculum manganireducens]|uniref:Uncharacterized protein n=1 Tax=Labilibaculum manganireducens TaxID=1940525 RepID=A0A2N3IDM4_9BACT|nr:hypothetical protein BZG01_04075 [Labilibaculum manganireducens]